MSFSLSNSQRSELLGCLGRTDAGALHLLADIESSVSAAWAAVERHGGIPAELRAPWTLTAQLAARLRSDLYALPERTQALIAARQLTATESAALAAAADRCGAALEALSPWLDLAEARAGLAVPTPEEIGERLLSEIIHAFRNRLNIKASADPDSLFMRFLGLAIDMLSNEVTGVREAAQRVDRLVENDPGASASAFGKPHDQFQA